MKKSCPLGVGLLILLTCGRGVRADIINGLSDQSVESVLAQATFADLAVTSGALDQNPGAAYQFTYNGSTTGTSWSGSLTGQFLGISSSGSLSGSISPDPTWMIDSGNLTINGKPYALSGTFAFDANLDGSVNFTATAGTATINWTNVNALTVTADVKQGTTFAGTVRWTQNGRAPADYNLSITIGPPDIDLPLNQRRITSTITRGGQTQTINKGKGTFTQQTSFDGDESLDISSVPEPSSLVLLTLGIVGLAGYRCRRARRSPTVGSHVAHVQAPGLTISTSKNPAAATRPPTMNRLVVTMPQINPAMTRCLPAGSRTPARI